jgi:hypothetical protein
MEASLAAARLIEEYKEMRRRLGKKRAPGAPKKAIRRPYPLLLLPAMVALIAAWMMFS